MVTTSTPESSFHFWPKSIHKKDNKGRHVGYCSVGKKNIEFLVNFGGKSWLDQVDNEGKHMGFYCTDPEIMRFLIKSGGRDWILKTDNSGKHMGFYVSDELVGILAKSGGTKFTDNDGRHIGFYIKYMETLNLLFEIGGSSWLTRKDNNDVRFTLQK